MNKTTSKNFIKPLVKALDLTLMCTVLFFSLFLLTACHSNEANEQDNNPTNKVSATSNSPIKTIQLDLSDHALDKATFIGLIAPQVQEAAPCPFLSDQAAAAIVKSDWVLKRRETSNESCYWSKNLGFSVKLTVEPLATAKPVQARNYNMDSKPILKQQPAPGSKAFVLYDTTWDTERPYAMSFEQDDKLVMIYVTGMSTDATRLTAAAKEIAAKLSNQLTPTPQQNSSAAFDMCSTWSQAEIEAIIGATVSTTTGDLDCKWETGTGEALKQVRITIYSGRDYPWESLLDRGEQEISGIGERALMEKKRSRNNMSAHVLMNALYQQKLVTVTVTDTIADHRAVAVALAKNIDQRLK